jgi:chromosome partitioning protein
MTHAYTFEIPAAISEGKIVLVVAVVSSKGGTGKSTLAECLAVHAVGLSKSVFIVDLDPQQSTAAWWRRRQGPENPWLITGKGSVIRALREVQSRKEERDVMVIDTPGHDLAVVDQAIQAADVVVVVAQAAIKDLEAQGAVGELIKNARQEERALYVVNRADSRSSFTRNAVEALARRSPHRPLIIAERADYLRADITGKTGNEVSKKSEAEITAIWDEIVRISHGEAAG